MHGGRVSSVLRDRELRDIAVVRGPGWFCFLVVLLLLLRVKRQENEKVAFERTLARNGKCSRFAHRVTASRLARGGLLTAQWQTDLCVPPRTCYPNRPPVVSLSGSQASWETDSSRRPEFFAPPSAPDSSCASPSAGSPQCAGRPSGWRGAVWSLEGDAGISLALRPQRSWASELPDAMRKNPEAHARCITVGPGSLSLCTKFLG